MRSRNATLSARIVIGCGRLQISQEARSVRQFAIACRLRLSASVRARSFAISGSSRPSCYEHSGPRRVWIARGHSLGTSWSSTTGSLNRRPPLSLGWLAVSVGDGFSRRWPSAISCVRTAIACELSQGVRRRIVLRVCCSGGKRPFQGWSAGSIPATRSASAPRYLADRQIRGRPSISVTRARRSKYRRWASVSASAKRSSCAERSRGNRILQIA